MKRCTPAFGGRVTIHETEESAKEEAYLAMAFSNTCAYVRVYPLAESWIVSYLSEPVPGKRYLA
jgi:hypothetical protein